MTKLSDTQLVILSAAAARTDSNVLPLPGWLRGGAATKVVGALLTRGLIAERIVKTTTKADAALNRIWRNEPDGRAVLIEITDAGLAAIGVETGTGEAPADGASDAATSAPDSAEADAPEPATTDAETTPDAATEASRAGKTRERTKQATLIAMLRAPGGATIAEIAAATQWQSHTIRGALSGALKKKLGLEVTSEKDEVRGRIYKLPEA